jgi:hypothetical protein
VRWGGLLLGAALLAGCITDPYREPVAGREAHILLLPGVEAPSAEWPVSYRRGAIFVIENGTAAPVETLIVDLSGPGQPRELLEAAVEDPPGVPTRILWAPHGNWALRTLVGTPGRTLLEPGASLRLRLQVAGEPGLCRAKVTVPR